MNSRKTEVITKGLASHRRLYIVEMLFKKPEMSVEEIAKVAKISHKNASGHINKLTSSGLIMKRHDGNFVRHKLTKRGETILKFLRILE
ncbi:MAG: winged helix-turn-helix domain-containing protein [Patescibacteria group bacterium]